MFQQTFRFARNFALVAGLSIFAIACDDDDDDNNNPTPADVTTIAELAVADPELATLLAALQATGLDAVVADENANLTVFAPDNDAFQALLDALQVPDLAGLVNLVGADAVTEILKYHVIGTEVKSGDLSNGYATTLGMNARGEMMSMYINIDNGVVINNDAATVTQADIDADNGVIHKINAVILPPTIADLLIPNPDYSVLIDAVLAADASVLDALTDKDGVWTLFAPDNDAFVDLLGELGVSDLAGVLVAVGQDGLTDILFYHVLGDEVTSSEVMTGTGIQTALSTGTIDIAVDANGGVTITDGSGDVATVEAVDIQGSNGVVHRINEVILPQ